MGDPCNHAVVGVLAEWDGRYLTGLRAKPPVAVAPCAGHVDELPARLIPAGDDAEERYFRSAGCRELEEETGLRVRPGDLALVVNRRGGDRCHRKASVDGANWHWWRVYSVAVTAAEAKRVRSNGELNDLTWRTPAELAALPNLEPIWGSFLHELHII
jgi:8-oxo-dGTP pyrophosphatase MutT (NUDIX family)